MRGDIASAMNTFSIPVLPPLRSHENYIAAVKVWASTLCRTPPAPELASAFWELRDHGITDAMLQVLDAMGALTLVFNHCLQGKPKPAGLTLGKLYKARTAIGKRLLLLPSNRELTISSGSSPNIYECYRLTGLIYGVAVVFQEPILKTYDILHTYVVRLKSAIERSDLKSSGVKIGSLSRVFLWILVLGGSAALDKPERRWISRRGVGLFHS
jgi:hypothetical protein